MAQDRPGPNANRILVARITGTARHHAKWRDLTRDEETAAVVALTQLAAGGGGCQQGHDAALPVSLLPEFMLLPR
jgi:hypothetical protein